MKDCKLTSACLTCLTLYSIIRPISAEIPRDGLISESNYRLTSSLFDQQSSAASEVGDLLYSPVSLQVILGLTYMGASKNTASEMATALGLPNNPDTVKHSFRDLIRNIVASNITINVVNKIFISKRLQINTRYSESANEHFQAEIQTVDFANVEKVTREINDWVSNKTANLIKSIVSEDSFSPDAAVLLVNAFYFKGKWKTGFDPDNTERRPFYGASESDMEMMSVIGHFPMRRYGNLNATVIELPYVDDAYSLTILLPDSSGITSQEVEYNVHGIGLRKLIHSKMATTEVLVTIPKFTLEAKTKFKPYLQWMGMKEMFAANADFSRMVDGSDTRVEDVLQHTVLEVSEDGTEAAAATSVQTQARSLPMPAEEFTADHPFVFVLRNKILDVVLFVGRFTNEDYAELPKQRAEDDVGQSAVTRHRMTSSLLVAFAIVTVVLV